VSGVWGRGLGLDVCVCGGGCFVLCVLGVCVAAPPTTGYPAHDQPALFPCPPPSIHSRSYVDSYVPKKYRVEKGR